MAENDERASYRSELAPFERRDVPAHLKRGMRPGYYPRRCYERAGNYAVSHAAEPGVVLVHGTVIVHVGHVVSPAPHAWAEIGAGLVYEGTVGRFYEREGYYRAYSPSVARTYTGHEAARMMRSEGHWGPW